jgi:hypothetical protein
MGKAGIVFLSCAVFFLLSCSQAQPEIRYGSLELVYFENGGKPVERLSFFVLPADGDGFDDLEELWLCHDWEGLSWHMTSADWIQETINSRIWVGSRAIAMNDGSPLPRGQYRAVLVDKGGEKTERLFTFDTPERKTFPSLVIDGSRYLVKSNYPQHNLIAYDNEGVYMVTVQLSATEGEISELGLSSMARSVSLWCFDPEQSVSAITDVIPLND